MAGYIDIDASVADHPDFLAAGGLAGVLWVSGVAWCNRHHPDLFIPKDQLGDVSVLSRPGPLAQRLVAVGLWKAETLNGVSGFRVVDNGLFRLRGNQCERRRMTPALRSRVLERDQYQCRTCGALSPLQIDHIYPVSKGGRTVESNLQVLCAPCNVTKGAKLV